jgi:hypothetical protein
MASGALPVDRLRNYLRDLPAGARALLITELERAVMRGDEIPGGDLLLRELRAVIRNSSDHVPRMGNAARLLFRPIEPFLTSVSTTRKLRGRIVRAALEPAWTWISRDLAPVETQAYCDLVNHEMIVGDLDSKAHLAHGFQAIAAQRMQQALAVVPIDERAGRRIAIQIGTPNALDDVRDLATILGHRDELAAISDQLPGHIRNFGDDAIDNVKALVDSPACSEHGLQAYVLVMVMNRLAAPWQLIRLALRACESDHAARVASSPYAIAVDITLGDIERMVEELRGDLKRGATLAVTALLKCIHDAARGVRTELDLTADSIWTRRLAAVRTEISTVLKAEIESVPGQIRRLLRPRSSNEIVQGSVLDAHDVADTEARIEFVAACRNYASELAINEITLRAFQDIQQYLDTVTRSLLEGLRTAGEPDHAFRRSQVDAANRFCGKMFGKDYGSLLEKAAEMAGSERRAMRA